MASTVPAKSQALHNFALPHLKWKKNQNSNNHQRGRCSKLSSSGDADSGCSPQRRSHSPMRRDDSGCESGKSRKVRSPQNTGGDNGKNGTLASSSPDQASGKSEKRHNKVSENKEGIRSKILLKLPRKSQADELSVDEEAVSKTWNLRPRKPTHENTTQSCHRNVIRPEPESNSSERKKRLRFSIPLSKEEIDDDIFSWTGSKPSRRPKKRAKAVQKQLDNVFPGLWLASITPDSYKVSENQHKV